ncbi:MAG: hypothetical protein RRY12_09960 [Cloacibacillus sp.]
MNDILTKTKLQELHRRAVARRLSETALRRAKDASLENDNFSSLSCYVYSEITSDSNSVNK